MNISQIMAYKSVYALSTLNEKTKKLKATHYACCLAGGRDPIWGVWTVTGRFIRFHNGRESISKEYPTLVWRRVMARWQMEDPTDYTNRKKRVVNMTEKH